MFPSFSAKRVSFFLIPVFGLFAPFTSGINFPILLLSSDLVNFLC